MKPHYLKEPKSICLLNDRTNGCMNKSEEGESNPGLLNPLPHCEAQSVSLIGNGNVPLPFRMDRSCRYQFDTTDPTLTRRIN